MKEILCIANSPLSLNNANGKFLRNYLKSYNDNELASFYISSEPTDNKIDSFQITNIQALFPFFKAKNSDNGNSHINTHTPLKHLIRYLIWNTRLWEITGFWKWAKALAPKYIAFVLGDNPYLMKLAIKCSKKFNAKIVVFVAEDYPIKNHNYLQKSKKMGFLFRFFKKLLLSKTKKLFQHSSLVVFNTPYLMNDYVDKFHITYPVVFFPPADCKIIRTETKSKSILYAGNLGLGRDKALREFATECFDYDNEIIIDVFSKVSNDQKLFLESCQNIIVHDYISNDELINRIKTANVLLHIEEGNEYNKMDLKHAFSTKIANNIFMGNKCILYAPKELDESKYFLQYLPNNIATSKSEIKKVLSFVYENPNSETPFKVKLNHDPNSIPKSIRNLIDTL